MSSSSPPPYADEVLPPSAPILPPPPPVVRAQSPSKKLKDPTRAEFNCWIDNGEFVTAFNDERMRDSELIEWDASHMKTGRRRKYKQLRASMVSIRARCVETDKKLRNEWVPDRYVNVKVAEHVGFILNELLACPLRQASLDDFNNTFADDKKRVKVAESNWAAYLEKAAELRCVCRFFFLLHANPHCFCHSGSFWRKAPTPGWTERTTSWPERSSVRPRCVLPQRGREQTTPRLSLRSCERCSPRPT